MLPLSVCFSFSNVHWLLHTWTFWCPGCGHEAPLYLCRYWHPLPHWQTQISVQLEKAEMMKCERAEREPISL